MITEKVSPLFVLWREVWHAKLLTVLVGIGLAGFFLWLSMRNIDISELKEKLLSADRAYILPFIVAQTLFYGLKLQRWRALMPGNLAIRSTNLLTPMMFGFAANNLLPVRLGEIVRIYYAGKLLGLPKALVFGTVVVEKLFDIAAIACIFIAGLLFIAISAVSVNGIHTQLLTAVLAVLLTAAIFPPALWFAKRDHHYVIKRFPLRWQKTLHRFVAEFSTGVTGITGKRHFLMILGNSLLQWLLLALCIYFSMAAFSVDPLHFSTATTVLGLLVLGVSLPSGPGFVGSVEYAFVFGLGLFGYVAAQGLAVAVFYHVISFFYVLLAGGLCLLNYWLTPERLVNRQ